MSVPSMKVKQYLLHSHLFLLFLQRLIVASKCVGTPLVRVDENMETINGSFHDVDYLKYVISWSTIWIGTRPE